MIVTTISAEAKAASLENNPRRGAVSRLNLGHQRVG
jgi:hypothetical protein